MPGDFSRALKDAGLVTQKQIDREETQKERRQKRAGVGMNPRNEFRSVKDFLKSLPVRLKSPADMKTVFRDFHWLADDLALNHQKRARCHAFLCRVQTELESQKSDFLEWLEKEVRKY